MPLFEISPSDMSLPRNVTSYLSRYGLKDWKLTLSHKRRWNTAVVVPALNEFENVKTLLSSLAHNDRKYFSETIIIFCVNNMAGASDEIKENNAATIKFLKEAMNNPGAALPQELAIGYVDASSSGNELPDKDGGVGLARKIGMDLALCILDYESAAKKALICLDADCMVSPDYITEITGNFNSRNISAAGIRFEHPLEGPYTQAIICYEIFLRYYVLGLRYAGSPYAFHTIGSSMACDHESYIKIGGMNKRKAAEDFYFLEKLSKNVKIDNISSAVVYPSGRPSDRVPFGTGRSVTRFMSHERNEYLLYSPASFELLKEWMELYNAEETLSGEEYLLKAGELSPELKSFLEGQNFRQEWNNILRNSKGAKQINRQKALWFDGFRMLKFIHYLRDNGYPMIDMFPALDEIFLKTGIKKPERTELIPPLPVQIQYLQILREIDSGGN